VYRAVIGALALCLLCLLVLAFGYVRQQREAADLRQELELLRQRADADHAKLWRDDLYIPYLEERLAAAHEKGTPAGWRALVLEREAKKKEEQQARRDAGMAGFMQRLEKRKAGGGR
jgi:hypothetical protein